jgi:hypothetical protein
MLAAFLPLLGACNMAISETPLFADADKANLTPRDGLWLSEDAECRFDSNVPESQWPKCAIWAVVKGSSGQMLVRNGKGEDQQARFVIAKGEPPIVQVLWRDDAKEDGKTFYVFFGLKSETEGPDKSFTTAATWEVKCGTKDPTLSDIKPYPGLSSECRPSSPDAVRSAAVASRSTAEMAMTWRWLRPAGD